MKIWIPLLAAMAGCTSSSGTAPEDSGAPVDSGPLIQCQSDPRVDTFTANMTKTSKSGTFKVAIAQADPAPPARGTNTWTVKLTDANGAPIANAPLDVLPFMPDHGHGTSVRAVVTASPDGTYSVTPLYLFMAGVWRITFTLGAPDAAPPDTAEFFFCVPG